MIFSKSRSIFLLRFLAPVLLLAALSFPTSAAPAEEPVWTSDFRIGGVGGVYFLLEPGPFWVEVEKQDLNRRDTKTHLRAILVGPDRTVLGEEYLAHQGMEKDSGVGPVQRTRFEVDVPQKGVYVLSITITDDRYGVDTAWGIRTNAAHYLIETSRSHKDARHEEPIVLQQGDTPGSVCFLPRNDAFTLDLSGFRREVIQLRDSTGTVLADVPVDDEGVATWTVPAAEKRDNIPWELHFSGANGTVNIDGVTRWDREDRGNTDLSLWSPRPERWFPFHENRWLLTPYKQAVNVVPGESGAVTLSLHNNGVTEKTVALALSYAPGVSQSAMLSSESVVVPPETSVPVTMTWQAPDDLDPATVYVHGRTEGGFETYATVELRPRAEHGPTVLDLPLVLEPYRHENEQFGYRPDYPVTDGVYFDRENRPFIAAKQRLAGYRDSEWTSVAQEGLWTGKVAFDGDNDVYVIGRSGGNSVLRHSQDGGQTFTDYAIPGTGYFDLEQFSGHNTPTGPPPFLQYHRTASDPKHIWRRIHDVALFVPEKHSDGRIALGAPIPVSQMCIGLSTHSGIPSSIVSRGDKVHIVWAEATDPAIKVPGVPTYVATYDRSTGTLSEPALVGYGPPANDVHNTPSITMDSQGYLHVLIGTHGYTFPYATSLAPNDSQGGWTEAVKLGPGIRQTYVGFVCGPDDTLHVVFRQWNLDTTYFPASIYASLSYMQKKPGEAWSEPQHLVVPAFSEYSVFYHRLTIDREGALFLSYDYWSTFWFYRTDRRETRRALMMRRPDDGRWALVDHYDWKG